MPPFLPPGTWSARSARAARAHPGPGRHAGEHLAGAFAKTGASTWTFGALRQTTLASIQGAAIEVPFGQSGWTDDELVLEYSANGRATAHRLAAFGPGNAPPAGLTTHSFSGPERVLSTPARASAVV